MTDLLAQVLQPVKVVFQEPIEGDPSLGCADTELVIACDARVVHKSARERRVVRSELE